MVNQDAKGPSPEDQLKHEYINSPQQRMCGMIEPQQVWAEVEHGALHQLAGKISNCLEHEMSFTAEARKD